MRLKELNGKLRSHLPHKQINSTMTLKTQIHLIKIEILKQSNKLNKNILIAKTLEAFTPKEKFDPFKYTNCKNMLRTKFCF